jgi:predicted RNA-binding Zn-ribbon protein involved in translation (DUF1610 family)
VPALEKVPAQTSEVATWHGPQGKVLKELAKSQRQNRQTAFEDCQHQKGFRTQGFERHQQKPRGCLYRGPAGKEYEQVSNQEGGAKVWAESLHLGRQQFALRSQLKYKTQWQGGLLVPVPPQNTSRKCPECGQVAAENRKSQAKFACLECGFSANADFVAAVNIREAGLASLACSQPSGDVSPSCQEPTEGIPA